MIRVCKDGKKKYVSLGVSVLPQFWDFTKNQPKKNCPNKAYIEKIIADKSSEFAERIIELKSEKKEFTATMLTERFGFAPSPRCRAHAQHSQMASKA